MDNDSQNDSQQPVKAPVFSFESIDKGGIGSWDHNAVRVARNRSDQCYMVIGTPAARALNSTSFNISYDSSFFCSSPA